MQRTVLVCGASIDPVCNVVVVVVVWEIYCSYIIKI
jgi:hypothetical protein